MIATATEMKAIVQDVYGSADVLQLREIEKPQPNEGEVLLRVRAAGVEPGVWHLMMGRPYLVSPTWRYGLSSDDCSGLP